MAYVKSLGASLILALAAFAVADPAVSSSSDNPRELLFKAIEGARHLSFDAIVVRRSSSVDRTPRTVKIAQKGRASKTTVLKPLQEQGVTTVDDGRLWQTFIPDENRLIQQDSSHHYWHSRTTVAAGNYEFTSEKTDFVAGRKALSILASPKAPEMPSRRYWIDLDNPITLRFEIIKDGNRHVLMMDTQDIRFGDVADDAVRINPPGDVRRIVFESPRRFRSAEEAVGQVGFRPTMPGSLPFGFSVMEPQVVGERDLRFVALRLSDGLASATVYQWNAKGPNPIPCPDRDFVREANGVKIKVVGDLPEVVLSRLLDSILRDALKGLMPLAGTDSIFQALLPLQKDSGASEVELVIVFTRDY